MSYVSKFIIGDEAYDIKDSEARAELAGIPQRLSEVENEIAEVNGKITIKYETPSYIYVNNQAEFDEAINKLNAGVVDLRVAFNAAGTYIINNRVINFSNFHFTNTSNATVNLIWNSTVTATPSAMYYGKFNLIGTSACRFNLYFTAGGEDTSKYTFYGAFEDSIISMKYVNIMSPISLYNCSAVFDHCNIWGKKVGTEISSESDTIICLLSAHHSMVQLDNSVVRLENAPANTRYAIYLRADSTLITTHEIGFATDGTLSVPYIRLDYSRAVITTDSTSITGLSANNPFLASNMTDILIPQALYNQLSDYITAVYSVINKVTASSTIQNIESDGMPVDSADV